MQQKMKRLLYLGIVLIAAGALVTFFAADSGRMHLRCAESGSGFVRKDGSQVQLPFSLRLDSFSIEYYPNSQTPRDYVSEVTLLPSGQKKAISMNHILRKGGYRFFQADYDPDLQGSTLAVNHDPWGTGLVYAGYLLFLAFFLWRTVKKLRESELSAPKWLRRTLCGAGLLLLAGCFSLICSRLVFRPLMPVLRSPLLWIHVLSIIVSYAAFALLAVCGLWGLVSTRSGAKLAETGLTALYPAQFMLAFGIVIGSLWANISWGNYWSWDPKETWALITFLVYSLPLCGLRYFRKPKVFSIFCIVAFLCVLFTYFGVNYLLGGLHAYY